MGVLPGTVNVLDTFHPAVAGWFRRTYAAPTEPQVQAWPAISSGNNALIAAPTGSGKTLAAFLATIDALIRLGVRGELRDEIHVVYVSPLKALSNDIQKNLDEPLAGIRKELLESGMVLRFFLGGVAQRGWPLVGPDSQGRGNK